jgi:Sulfotransferase family
MTDTALVGIFGAGRNGSTLVSRLLDGSPDLWIHPIDVVFLPVWNDFAARGSVRGESFRTASARPLRHLDLPLEWSTATRLFIPQLDEIESEYLPRLIQPRGLNRDPLARLDLDGTVAPAEFFPAFLEATRRSVARYPEPAPRLLGFKTSETAYVDEFVRLWPEMRFVHIFRDPISNYASAKRTWTESKHAPFWTHGEDLLRVFLEARWLPHARAILRYRESDPARHLVVLYEDLVVNPASEVLRLCAGLGVRPPSDPTLQTILGGERVRTFPPNPSQPGVETPQTVVPDMAERFGYNEVVTAREAQLIARATGDLAAALGYPSLPKTTGRLSLWLRWLPVDASERRNATSRARLALELVKRRAYVTRALLGS